MPGRRADAMYGVPTTGNDDALFSVGAPMRRPPVLPAITPSDTIPHMSLRGGPKGTDVAIRSHCNDTIRCYSPHVIARRSRRDRRGNPFPRNDIVRYCFPACQCEEVPKGPTWQSVLIAMTPSDTIPHMSLRGAQRRGNPALLRADFFIHENPAAQNC